MLSIKALPATESKQCIVCVICSIIYAALPDSLQSDSRHVLTLAKNWVYSLICLAFCFICETLLFCLISSQLSYHWWLVLQFVYTNAWNKPLQMYMWPNKMYVSKSAVSIQCFFVLYWISCRIIIKVTQVNMH